MPSLLPIFPFLIGLTGAAGALLWRHHEGGLRFWVVLIQLALLGVGATILVQTSAGAILVHKVGGWAPPVGIAYVADRFSALFGAIVAFVASAALVYALLDEEPKTRHRAVCLFFMLEAGMFGVIFSGDIFHLYVCYELFGVASYGLVAYRGEAAHVEAALKYASLSLLASILMLIGIGAIYAQTGTLTFASLHQASLGLASPPLYVFSVVLVLVALCLKASLFPLHTWLPDAHSVAPTAVSILLSGAVVKVGAYAVFRILYSHADWLTGRIGAVLLPLAAITAVVAAGAAFVQTEFKRFLAYSTASQMGYVLAAGALGTSAGLRGAVVYAIIHASTKATLFGAAGVADNVFGSLKQGRMSGLSAHSPLLSIALFVALFSLAGIPPLAGFTGKLAVFAALAKAHSLFALGALVIASFTILTAAGRIWLRVSGGETPKDAARPPRAKLLLVSAMALFVVALGLGLGPLIEGGDAAASQLIEGSAYREAVLETWAQEK